MNSRCSESIKTKKLIFQIKSQGRKIFKVKMEIYFPFCLGQSYCPKGDRIPKNVLVWMSPVIINRN